MNLKPTPSQVKDWYDEACKRLMHRPTERPLYSDYAVETIAELAANWGAEQMQSASTDAQDAKRWRYTQQKGYFYVRPTDYGDRYLVGIQRGRSVNASITGEGSTLAEAIDNALDRS